MCKIIFLYFLYLICTNSYYVIGFNESVADLLKNGHSAPRGGLADFGKKGTVLPRFETLKHSKSDDDHMEDDEEQADEDEDEHIDEKSDTVDTALNEAEERHAEEEKKLEDAEDVGLKESIDEEKAESNYASEASEADNRKKKGKENGNLSYLMDQMVKLSLELKQITNEINLMA